MNPILLLVFAGAAYAWIQQQSKPKGEPKPSEPKPGGPGEAGGAPKFEPRRADYTDSRGIAWSIVNNAPDSWIANATGPLARYFEGSLRSSSRPDLIKKIEKATQSQATEQGKDYTEDLKDAIAAANKDAAASAKAYEDSWMGFQVAYVDDNFDEEASSNWQRTYNDALNDRLQKLGYYIDQDGYVKKY